MRDHNYLFCKFDIHQLLQGQEGALNKEIDEIEGSRLLDTSVEELILYFKDKYNLPAPKLLEDQITVDQNEAQIDVSHDINRFIMDRDEPFHITGTKITFYIPFEGDKDLFQCQPSSYSLNPPRGDVTDKDLVLSYQTTDHNGEAIKGQFTNDLAQIKGYLTNIEGGVSEFNTQLENKIRQRLEGRRKKIMDDQGMVASLGFPLKKRNDFSETYIASQVKRKIVPRMPDPSSVPFKPEPVLEMQEYEHILKIISDMVVVMERSPKAFESLDEETLRKQILVPLNGHYEGQATGETFNASGKTDILIRADDKNIFIAECKFWKGEEYLKEAIVQLLGYTSWRDTKTSIIIFNRNKNLSAILDQIPSIVKQSPNFLRDIEYSSETGFRYVLHQNGDKGREIILTVLVFDIPTAG